MNRFAPRQKLALHTQFADYIAGERVWPINVEISPSGICQATCGFCGYANGMIGGHRNVMLGWDVLSKLLQDFMELGVKSVSWTGGGEPSLYPFIGEAVESAKGYWLDQGIFTNALSMPKYDPSLMEWIRITMTDKMWKPECIKPLRKAKTLGFAFNYSGPQDNEYLLQTLHMAEDVMADYVQLRPALKQNGETVDIQIPDIQHPLLQVTEYKFEEAKKKHGYSKCEGYHLIPFVWETGEVSVCSYMRPYGEKYVLGNLYEKSFKQIMDGAPPFVPVIEQCQVCCKNHELNMAIDESRQLTDRNFP